MTQHDRLIDFCLTEPGALLPRGEDLHCHFLSSPLSPPHLPKAAFPDTLLQDDGPGNGPLHQQWET